MKTGSGSASSGQSQGRSNGGGRGRGRGRGRGGTRRGRGRQTGGFGGNNPGSGPRNPLARDGDYYNPGPVRNQRRGRYNRDEPYQTRADTDDRWSHDQYDVPSVSTSVSAVSTDGKIIISNLDPSLVDEDLQDIFKEFPITSCHINYDRDGRSLGTGEVVFSRSHHANKAVKEFDNAEVDGVPMTVRLTTTGAVSAARIVKKAAAAPQVRAPRQPRGRGTVGTFGAFGGFGNRGNNRGRRGSGGARRGRGGSGRGGSGRGGGAGARAGRGNSPKKTVEQLNKEMDDWRAAGSTTEE